MQPTITAILLFFCLSISSIVNAQDVVKTTSINSDTLTVVGDGFVELAPDLLDMQFTLMTTKMTILEAKQELDKQYQQVLTLLQEQQIADKDIKATQLRSNPSYEWLRDKKIFKGFQISRNITLTIRDFSQYPVLLQALVEADVSMINRVSTRLSDQAGSEELAIIEAIKVAKRKAELMASRFGRNLGEVQHISEGLFQNHLPQSGFRSKSNRALSVESDIAVPPTEMFGLQRINARVQVIFRLQ